MPYKVEKDWITRAGLRAIVILIYRDPSITLLDNIDRKAITITKEGVASHRCGYVRIEKDHPLYGVGYGEPTLKIPYEWVEHAELGKKSPILVFTCGVGALAGEDIRRSPDIAFDVHGGLTFSKSGERGYPVKDDGWWFGFDCAHAGDTLEKCTLEYVADECERLAEQLVRFEKEVKKEAGDVHNGNG